MVGHRLWIIWLCCLACASDGLLEAQTREQELEERRRRDGGVSGDDQSSKVEQALDWSDDHKVLDRLSRGVAGFRVVFGNLIPGSGFGVGPEYYRDELRGGAIQFRTSVRASTGKS